MTSIFESESYGYLSACILFIKSLYALAVSLNWGQDEAERKVHVVSLLYCLYYSSKWTVYFDFSEVNKTGLRENVYLLLKKNLHKQQNENTCMLSCRLQAEQMHRVE